MFQIERSDQDQTWTKEQWSEIDLNLRQVCESATVDCICFNSNLSEEEPNDYEDTKAEDVAKRRVLIRRKLKPDDFLEVRVAVLGNVDAGKSTLLGVLTHGHLDDGRGSARQHLLRHLHEQQTGRTSSVGCNILGFDSSGRIVNESCVHGTRLHWQEVCMRAGKVLSLLDLAGHERYLKTTIFGLTGLAPHCSMLMVGGNAGLIGMGREHLGLCLALSLPVFVVVSKVDSAPANVLQQTLATLQRLLRSSSCRRTPLLVRDINDVWLAADAIAHRRPLCPVFQLSSVTGHNMRFIKQFLSLLSPNTAANVVATTETPSRPPITLNSPEFYIEETFSVPGVGTVVSGLCASGRIEPNDTLMLGPDRTGKFNPVQIKSIHRKRLPVTEVHGGHSAALALKKVKKSDLRKGMVLVSSNLNPKACWEFVAEIIILHHPTTISKNYQAMGMLAAKRFDKKRTKFQEYRNCFFF